MNVDIDKKTFYSVISDSLRNLVTRSESDITLRFGLIADFDLDQNIYQFDQYCIERTQEVFLNRKKYFYKIICRNTDEILHSDLALFETALAILKKYVNGGSGIDILLQLDAQYQSAMYEAWSNSERINQSNYILAQAKIDAAKQRMNSAKKKIVSINNTN